jgi:hypothetical protein
MVNGKQTYAARQSSRKSVGVAGESDVGFSKCAKGQK